MYINLQMMLIAANGDYNFRAYNRFMLPSLYTHKIHYNTSLSIVRLNLHEANLETKPEIEEISGPKEFSLMIISHVFEEYLQESFTTI